MTSTADWITEHELAVVRAEIRRLVMALRPYGVLRRDVLARVAGALSWHQASFDRALHAAVQAGEIEERPLGFYAIPHPASDEAIEPSSSPADAGRDV
jgi:hypothetical protein